MLQHLNEDVWVKVKEECAEVEEASSASPEPLEEEFGDLLFAVINAARLYGVDPEAALSCSSEKFRHRKDPLGYLFSDVLALPPEVLMGWDAFLFQKLLYREPFLAALRQDLFDLFSCKHI